MNQIIPGVLEKDWESVEKKINTVLPFARSIHIDLLDGVFAPNKSFQDPQPFAKFAKDVTLELHMMVQSPIEFLEPWASAGFKRFIGQVEMMESQVDFVSEAQALGEVGLAVDSPTDPEEIKVPYDDLDFLFVMTVKAGFSNQSFLPENLKKVEYFRRHTHIPIEVDGGINDITAEKARKAGATRFVSTGYIFGADNPKVRYEELREIVTP